MSQRGRNSNISKIATANHINCSTLPSPYTICNYTHHTSDLCAGMNQHLADSGLTEVMTPDCRQYTLYRGNVPVEENMQFDLVTHDPDALFNIFANQLRDQAAIEANDAERRQTGKRRDATSMAAAGTMSQGNAADEHDSRENTKAAGVKPERDRRYDNNECLVGCKQGHKPRNCPQTKQGTAGKGVYDQSQGQTPILQQQSTIGPAEHTRSKGPDWALRLPPLELICTRQPQKRWIR